MEKFKGMFVAAGKLARKVAPGAVVMAASGAAMAAETTTGGGFDIMGFLNPVVDALKSNIGEVVPVVAVVFGIYWSATSGIQIVKKFLSKVV